MDRLTDEVKLEEAAQFHFGLDYTIFNGQSISADQALLAQWNATSAYTWRLEAGLGKELKKQLVLDSFFEPISKKGSLDSLIRFPGSNELSKIRVS